MKNYLNNAGAGKMSKNTFDAYINHLNLERSIGAYNAANKAKLLLNDFYINAAKTINADQDEIAFVDSASRGWNIVVNGIELEEGSKIITLQTEFGTNLITLFNKARNISGELTIIPCDKDGLFDIGLIESELKNGAKMIAISHAAAHGSISNPVYEIGKLAKKYNVLYIVDGCQSLGQMYVDVKEMNCDAFVTTGRKWLCGPRGTGFIYVRKSSKIKPNQLDLASTDIVFKENNTLQIKDLIIRDDAKKFELWERNIAGMIALSTALKNLISNMEKNIFNKIQNKAIKLRKAVMDNPNLIIIGKLNSESGIIGFYLKDPTREKIVRTLFEKIGINISSMSDWDCPSHFPKNGVSSIFRLSPHYYTDNSTINKAIDVISKI